MVECARDFMIFIDVITFLLGLAVIAAGVCTFTFWRKPGGVAACARFFTSPCEAAQILLLFG